MGSTDGRRALAALDRALGRRPADDGEAFSEATEQLCRLRDALIADCRTGATEQRDRLGRLNATISAVLGGHFPIGKVPWTEVQAAADHLRTLIEELDAQSV